MSDVLGGRNTTRKAREIGRRIFSHESIQLVLVLAVIIAVFGTVTKGKAVTLHNVQNIFIQSSARGMAAIGQAFVIITGGIDLTPTGLAVFATTVGGWLMTQGALGQPDLGGPELPLAVGIPIIVVIGLGVGAGNGALVSHVGVPALIATLGMWQITRGLALRLTGGFSIGGLPEGMAFFGQGYIAGVPVPTIIFIVSIILAYFVLMHTTFGRNVYAVGGNPVSAWLSGVNVKNTLLAVYIISGFTAALAGIILSSRSMAASLNVATNLELDSIASVVIGGVSLSGGRGSIWGVLIGVIIIGVVNNGINLMGVPHGMQDVVRGAIIIIAVTIDVLRRRRG